MKKIFMMMATAIILASCSQTELEESFVGQKEIKFSNLNDKVTRAANDAKANYKIYAAWTNGTNWFINDEVDGLTNLPANDPYHWPAAGTVSFYSWAPATVTATTDTYPDLSITYTVPSAANEDFTIATPKTGMSAASNPNIVALEFAHMLAKISVTASLHQDLIDAGYTLSTTGLTAELVVQLTGGTVNPINSPAVWTSPNGTGATYTGVSSYMVMPQTSTGCTVQVTAGIEIKDNGGNVIYTGNLAKYTIMAGNVPNDNFDMGKHYLLNLTISETSTGGGGENIFNVIEFSADVADWDTPTGTDTPLPQP